MKIAYIGTYPPRECGIGSFTSDLYESMTHTSQTVQAGLKVRSNLVEGFVVAINDFEKTYNYPPEVKQTIRQEHRRDYLEAARFINHSDANICILQHEFGIFGGQNGIYLLPLLRRLEIPLIVTLHTILKEPSYNEKAVLQQIGRIAHKIVVMSHIAVDFLVNIYQIDEDKIVRIEHGVPDIRFNQDLSKQELHLENRKVILTFGFVGRSKGIETAIEALPKVVKKHPEVLYMVVGETHPNVLRDMGEEYRVYLHKLVKDLSLQNHVVFINEFVNQERLFKYLSASDIYVTPYLNEAQITSGTLSYAVGVGSAVVSTPYWHATELLAQGRGRLFGFKEVQRLSEIFLELLDHPDTLEELRNKAYDYGRTTTWPISGGKYVSLAKDIINEMPTISREQRNIIDPLMLPPFSLDHILRLTDDTGIIQHAKFGIPNLKEGYCLDDNARALLMVLMVYRESKSNVALKMAPIYLSYIYYMQNKDGSFRNFLSFSRAFLDKKGSEDSFGRTIWGLGYLLAYPPNDAYYQAGKEIFFHAVPNFEKLQSIRAIANVIVGISYYLRTHSDDHLLTEILRSLTAKLIEHYDENSDPEWKWFESSLTYDNGMLPLALLHSAEILEDAETKEVAMASMNFLTEKTLSSGYLSIIGNEKWYKKGEERSLFAQQPIDALAMVLMFHQAFLLTHNNEYLDKLFTCFMWFLGENDIGMSLFDFETKGCCDGIDSHGVNRNQGAESTLAYLISHVTVLQAFEESEKIK
ncbi:MAG TPA: glycosyltransferase family 4 protein [Chitinophagaceae bacterium]|nr:glycosyltransferase family 4 protein [Chitinophagaceae bacterium]